MHDNPTPVPETTPAASTKPKRTGKPSLVEDLIVTGFGWATSTLVAWVSWWMAANWEFAPYAWMANFVIPIGAILCGFVAATGYWIGARWFNHKPSRALLFNIVLVSLSTFFAIHHLHYTHDQVNGRPIQEMMTFTDYLTAVTENMSYRSSHDSSSTPPTELGKWGWGVAALQVLGFSLGGFAVYGMLFTVPYCHRCSKYLSQKKSRRVVWKTLPPLTEGFQTVAALIQAGRLQEAIDTHATLGEKIRFKIKAQLSLELRKCPDCEHRRLQLIAQQHQRNWVKVGECTVQTEEPITMG